MNIYGPVTLVSAMCCFIPGFLTVVGTIYNVKKIQLLLNIHSLIIIRFAAECMNVISCRGCACISEELNLCCRAFLQALLYSTVQESSGHAFPLTVLWVLEGT